MTQTKSRDVIIREEEFRLLLGASCEAFGGLAAAVLEDAPLLESPAVIARLGQEAHALETFLDDYGARQNRTYVTFGELIASVRGLVTIKGAALHLTARLPRYQSLIDKAPLAADLDVARSALDGILISILGGLKSEAARLGLDWRPAAVDGSEQLVQRQLLPRNLDEEDSVDERQHIAEIGARFLKVLETSRGLELGFPRPKAGLAEFVATRATEERCRWYESTVHSIQSMYDTYVLHTSVERDHPWLQALRGHVSISLHLLEMATGLVHFYERHENDIRHEPARHAISNLVGKETVLDLAVNYCLRYAYLFVEGCSATANQILKTFVRQASTTLIMPTGITLHARPLALIVQVARHYGTPLEISLDGEKCSANSLMSLILLGGRHPRPKSIRVQGDSRALRDLEKLFEAGLGEQGRVLPETLSYLRVGS